MEGFKGKRWKSVRWENVASVFVNNLPEATGADQLRNAFSPMGKVYDAFIPASGRRRRGMCFGFVRFGEMETGRRQPKLWIGGMGSLLLEKDEGQCG